MSDYTNHCVYVFNKEGQQIHEFGKKGQGIGDFKGSYWNSVGQHRTYYSRV